jgi:hypothetical protein
VAFFFMNILKQIKKQNSIGAFDKYISHRLCNACKHQARKTIVIQATVLIYGSAATQQIAKQIAHNIQWHWNFPKAKILIQGIYYNVVFKIKGQYFSSINEKLVKQNKDQKIFFIRVENEVAVLGVSLMDGVCSNTGFFKIGNVAYKGASTEAHEFGHALGLVPHTHDGHPTDLDQRGKGVPGIMYPRGSWVDAQYQWDTKVAAGEYGGTVMPDRRRVRQLDIDMLDLPNRNWNNKGKIRLGKLSSKYHNAEFQ